MCSYIRKKTVINFSQWSLKNYSATTLLLGQKILKSPLEKKKLVKSYKIYLIIPLWIYYQQTYFNVQKQNSVKLILCHFTSFLCQLKFLKNFMADILKSEKNIQFCDYFVKLIHHMWYFLVPWLLDMVGPLVLRN